MELFQYMVPLQVTIDRSIIHYTTNKILVIKVLEQEISTKSYNIEANANFCTYVAQVQLAHMRV